MSDKSKSQWLPFDLGEEAADALKDEAVVSCYLGKVLQHDERRNTWGSSDLSPVFGGRYANPRDSYSADESFTFDLAAAKGKIEVQRRRGSKWTIDELPVVVISGEKSSLIIGEINSDKPLSGFLPLRKRLVSLKDYFLHFKPRSKNSVFRVMCQAKHASPAALPFYRHRSESRGGYYSLEWHESVAEQDLDGVLGMIHRVNKRLQHEASRAEGQ